MIKRLDNIKLNIFDKEDKLIEIARKKLGRNVNYFKILRKSLDARDKDNICWVYSIAFSSQKEADEDCRFEKIESSHKIAVVGSGPAGLFCALRLLEHGILPIIIERGEPVEKRRETIAKFFDGGELNVNSNVQFGEGGAGTFSDGKLNTQTHDGLNKDVLKIFNRFGAPEEILYLNKPHIGSDLLFGVLKNMREYIIQNGGEYLFNTQFIGFNQACGALKCIIIKDLLSGKESELNVDGVVLALGHSARDTFEMLYKSGIALEPRDFAVGVRIEHLAQKISMAQYGKSFKYLPPADYKLVSHAHERTVFSFCMCPGGVVIPASSEQGGVVVNGMSMYARDGVNSNSALMVQMKKEDFGFGIFDGMYFQREVERRAYAVGGNNYKAPVQLYGDFQNGKISDRFGSVKPTYAAGTVFAPLEEILPPIATAALKCAIPDMNKKLCGFADDDALLTGVETRFSSPVKILRDAEGESVSCKGIYPCGEGSGYSGGITSSAADGLAAAEKIFKKFKNH